MANYFEGKSVGQVSALSAKGALDAVMRTDVKSLKTLSPEMAMALMNTEEKKKLLLDNLDSGRKQALGEARNSRVSSQEEVSENLSADPDTDEGALDDYQKTSLPPEFKEGIDTPAIKIASKLITTYKRQGINAFIGNLEEIKTTNPAWGEKVYDAVMEAMSKEDRKVSSEFLQQLIAVKNGEMQNNFEDKLKQSLEQEKNPENKKVIELMMALAALGYEEPPKENPTEKQKSSSPMVHIVQQIASIDSAKIDNPEYKDFFEKTKKSFEVNIRTSMALDVVKTSTKILETSLLDRTKKDVTFVNSLEELRTMPKGELASALQNDGMSNWADSDAEVYFASHHVFEAMRLYVTYLYPQEIAKGKEIQNPITWAFEMLKKGEKIELGSDFQPSPQDYIFDVYTNKNIPITGGTIDPSSFFITKDTEIQLFDEYQKGEEELGEMSIWNCAPKNFREVFSWNTLSNPLSIPSTLILAGASKAGWNFHKDNEAFLSRGSTANGSFQGMMTTSEELFNQDFSKLMAHEGTFGTYEKLEIAKIQYLRTSRNYDEARALCVKILSGVLPKPTDTELNDKTWKLYDENRNKIEAQVRQSLEQDERIRGKYSVEQFGEIIKKISLDALKNKAYIDLMAEKAETMIPDGLSDYEKNVLDLFNNMNGAGWAVSDENLDTVVTVVKFVVETIVIVVATAGVGALIGGAAAGGAAATSVAVEGTAAGVGATNTVVTAGRIARAADVTVNAVRASEATQLTLNFGEAASAAARTGQATEAVVGATRASQAAEVAIDATRTGQAAEAVTEAASAAQKLSRLQKVEQLGYRFGNGNKLGKAVFGNKYVNKPITWAYEGTSRGARFSRLALKSSAYAEGQELMHGRSLQIIDDPKQAAFEIGSTMLTLWALGGTQKFMRGGFAKGAPALGQAEAGATAEAVTEAPKSLARRIAGRLNPVTGAKEGFSKASGFAGKHLDKLGKGRVVGEIPAEILVLNKVGEIEQWAALRAGVLSQDQIDANDQEKWKEYTQTLGVVLGFRNWKA